MFTFRTFLFQIYTKEFVPMADIFYGIVTDFLLAVPLHGGGYSFVRGGRSIRNLNYAFSSVSVM